MSKLQYSDVAADEETAGVQFCADRAPVVVVFHPLRASRPASQCRELAGPRRFSSRGSRALPWLGHVLSAHRSAALSALSTDTSS